MMKKIVHTLKYSQVYLYMIFFSQLCQFKLLTIFCCIMLYAVFIQSNFVNYVVYVYVFYLLRVENYINSLIFIISKLQSARFSFPAITLKDTDIFVRININFLDRNCINCSDLYTGYFDTYRKSVVKLSAPIQHMLLVHET